SALIGPPREEPPLGGGLDAPIVRHLLHKKFAQPRIAQRTAVHVVSSKVPPLLTQGSRGGDNEVFDGNFVRVIVAANKVVRRKSSPRLGAGGQVSGEQGGIVETWSSHMCLLSWQCVSSQLHW